MSVYAHWRGGGDMEGWGVAPPYGAYRGHYGDYRQSQSGQVGSGKLGGASSVTLGGPFEEKIFPDEVAGEEDAVAGEVEEFPST